MRQQPRWRVPPRLPDLQQAPSWRMLGDWPRPRRKETRKPKGRPTPRQPASFLHALACGLWWWRPGELNFHLERLSSSSPSPPLWPRSALGGCACAFACAHARALARARACCLARAFACVRARALARACACPYVFRTWRRDRGGISGVPGMAGISCPIQRGSWSAERQSSPPPGP
jgi:hypothetical protein